MISAPDLLLFAAAALLMALTPGPNMIYLDQMPSLIASLMRFDALAKSDPVMG